MPAHRPGGQTHFRVHIVSEAFRGKSRIERHRMINQTLSGELAGGVTRWRSIASAPGEKAYLGAPRNDAARHFNGTCTNSASSAGVSTRAMYLRFTASVISPSMPFTVFGSSADLAKNSSRRRVALRSVVLRKAT